MLNPVRKKLMFQAICYAIASPIVAGALLLLAASMTLNQAPVVGGIITLMGIGIGNALGLLDARKHIPTDEELIASLNTAEHDPDGQNRFSPA